MSNQITFDTLKKNIENFNKMLGEENSELIKINYWSLVEQQFKSYIEKNNSKGCIELIFQYILGKNFEILKLKNLFYLLINFARNINYDNFIQEFFKFISELIRNYNDTKIIFYDFLFDFAFALMTENEIHSHNIIIKNFFITFTEVDKSLVIFTLDKTLTCSENFLSLLEKNENFSFFFRHFFKKLVEMHQFDLVLKMIEILYSVILRLGKTEISKNENLIVLLSFMIKKIKKINLVEIDNFNNYNIKQSLVAIFIKIFILLRSFNISLFVRPLIEEYLLFLIEFCIQKNIFINEFICFFYEYVGLNFSLFNETLLIYVFIISNELYETKSLETIIKLLVFFINLNVEGSGKILYKLIPKLLFKKFEQQSKFKQSSNSKFIKDYEDFNKKFFIKSMNKNDEILDNDLTNNQAFEYYKNYEKYQNINDLSLIKFILKNSYYYENENECLIINTTQLVKYLNILFNLNLEKYNQNFKNFSLYFFSYLTFLFNSDHFEIIEIVISNLKNYPDKMFIKTTIYPLIVSFLQSSYIDKFFENIEINTKMNRLLFGLLFEYCREDSIANIIYKLITRLYSVSNSKVNNKELALDLYTEFILKKNSGKYVDIYYKFIISNLKKESNNIDIKSLNYKFLYKYCQSYDGSLLSDLEQYMTENFEKKLELLYNFADGYNEIDTLFVFCCVFEIIKKEESKNIIDKIFDYFNNNKFIKLISNFIEIFEDFSTEKMFSIIGNENINFSEILDIHKILANELNLRNKEIINLLIFRSISQIFSLFLNNLIVNNSEQLKDRKNYSTNMTIMQIFKKFDFLSGNIIFRQNARNNVGVIIYINGIFSNYDNLIFYYNTYSSFKAMHLIEENNLDLSLLNEVNNRFILDNNDKLFGIFSYSKNYPLLNDFINNIFKFESKFFEKKDTQESTNYVIEDINESFWSNPNEIKLQNNNYFSKIFIEKIFQIDEAFQDIQVFLVNENIILKYFKQHLKILNPQFFVIITYNILKQLSNQSREIQNNIFKNTYNLMSILIKQNKGAFITLLRLFMSEITLKKFCMKNKLSVGLTGIIEFIIKQTIIFNSYKTNTISFIIKIYDTVATLININNIQDEEFLSNCYNYQSLLVNIIIFITDKIKNEKKEVELNKKTLESIHDNLTKMLGKFINFLVTNRNVLSANNKNLYEYMDLIFNTDKFLIENKHQIVLLNETSNENKSIIEYINLFNETKELNKLNQILTILLGDKSDNEKFFFDNFVIYFRASNFNSKFAYDALQNLIFNKNYENFNKKTRIVFISLFTVYLIIEKKNQNMFLINSNQLFELSIFILHNIANRLDLHKSMNFPQKNILLN